MQVNPDNAAAGGFTLPALDLRICWMLLVHLKAREFHGDSLQGCDQEMSRTTGWVAHGELEDVVDCGVPITLTGTLTRFGACLCLGLLDERVNGRRDQVVHKFVRRVIAPRRFAVVSRRVDEGEGSVFEVNLRTQFKQALVDAPELGVPQGPPENTLQRPVSAMEQTQLPVGSDHVTVQHRRVVEQRCGLGRKQIRAKSGYREAGLASIQ